MRSTLAAWLLAAGCCLSGSSACAGGITEQGQTWDSIRKLPDWSGTWQAITWTTHVKEYGRGPYEVDAPFNEKGAALLATLKKLSDAGADVPTRNYRCIPLGFPGSMDGPAATLELLFTPGRVTIVSATNFVRRIYTDGRPHDDQFVTFHGDSIGHWEPNGALVVDTIGLDPGNEFILGLPQGKSSRAVERIHRVDKDTLVDEITLEAPEVLAKPWRHVITYKRQDFPVYEINCEQNNRSFDPATGKQGFDLTPP